MALKRLVLLVAAVLVLSETHFTQSSFRLNDASKNVDIGIDIGKAPDEDSSPPARYQFYRKGATRPFQTVTVNGIDMWDAVPKANVTRRYDEQSVINFGDFNFDGLEDVAINDGANGGYGGPSYLVYLYSKTARRYIYSKAFTRINHNGMNLGFMEIDRKKRMLYRLSKSGCCWHQKEGFTVIHGRPKKVYEFTEEVRADNSEIVDLTTRKLINGRWHERVRHAKTAEYYKE